MAANFCCPRIRYRFGFFMGCQHFMVEIRQSFGFVSYWKRLNVASNHRSIHNKMKYCSKTGDSNYRAYA